MGSGQKLCRLEIFISPASTAWRMPGSKLMRVPWLNSAYSKPSCRISASMARPSVCRWEFQQVENEYIQQNRGDRDYRRSGRRATESSGARYFFRAVVVNRQNGRGNWANSANWDCFWLAD